MRSAGLTSALLRLSTFLFLLFRLCPAREIDDKFIKRQRFDSPLSPLQFFEDSETVLVSEPRRGIVYRSTDAGASWEAIDDIQNAVGILLNPNDNDVAVVLGGREEHWITYNQGKRWSRFGTPGMGLSRMAPLGFHATDNKKIILNAGTPSRRAALYTKDGFESEPKQLKENAQQCMWAKEKEQFSSGSEKIDKSRILCIALHDTSSLAGLFDHRLFVSDDYFETQEETKMDDGRPGSGFESMVSATRYLLAARRSEGTVEMAMYTSVDGENWRRAIFGDQKIDAGGFTVMESTNHSIRVDVAEGDGFDGFPSPMGALYSSESNGTYFTKNKGHTNRNKLQFVDFEKMDNIQGVALMNIVGNYKEVLDFGEEKSLQSRITFDDGRSFQSMKGQRDDRKGDLHLHGYSELRNQGRVYSNKGAPGLLMGIGNLGDDLHAYEESNLWISDDGGVNWYFGHDGPHKYEFADSGAVLAAVADPGPIDHIEYSIDHGKHWKDLAVTPDEDDTFRPNFFTTISDSTSTKVVLTAQSGKGDEVYYWIYSIDFKFLDLRTCKKDDFEIWKARENRDGEAGCVMGQTQSFRRRKADAECFVDKEFKEPEPETKPCECTKEDFECATGFKRSEDRESCEPLGSLDAPKNACKSDDKAEKFEGPSGFRLIPGNECKQNDVYEKMLRPVERPCKDTRKRPTADGIRHTVKEWKTKGFREYRYLEKPDLGQQGFEDETILLVTKEEREAWKTRDHGKRWERIEEVGTEALFIYPNPNEHRDAYIVTASKDVYFTSDRAASPFKSFEVATPANDRGLPVLRFHPEKRHWLIWTGCGRGNSFDGCDPVTHVSRKRGDDWVKLVDGAGICEFIWRDHRNTSQNLVFCTREEGDVRSLVASDDWFDNEEVLFENVVNFATMSEFIVVATHEDQSQKYLALNASVDGKTFAPAKFPPKMLVTREGYNGYTVLDSSSHSIFLHATINSAMEKEYGTIVKSNSNGTNYVTSLSKVNRNAAGYVDFEKLQAVEGSALANVVDNVNEVEESGVAKKIKTKITHNDGADWDYIAAPAKDSEGEPYECQPPQKKDQCSLHLHGYTERRSPDDTYSSPSAIGLVLGIGNTGSYLKPKRDGDTFISRDGGITWNAAVKGQYMWEFGDQGSIIVLVEERAPTNKVLYSLDEGSTFESYTFTDDKEEYDIYDISTVPSDGSLNFLLWGGQPSGKRLAVTINLDFSGLFERPCDLDEDDPEGGDYYLWKPEHPFQENDCLFGHQALYHRKRQDQKSRSCYNGPIVKRLHKITDNCKCTARDFECDYNFERNDDGYCIQVGEQRDPIKDCEVEPFPDEYYPVSGYRRIPGNTCSGGVEQDRIKPPQTCPGKHSKHGTSGWLIVFIFVICAGAAGAVGWFVYTRWGGAQFGRIHLGDAGDGGTTTSRMRLPLPNLDTSSAFVRYPVMGISAVAATLMAVPMVVVSGGRWVRDRFTGGRRGAYSRLGGGGGGWSGGAGSRTYTSRGSFARGRDWTGQASDESDLLGEDSDEET